MASFAGIAEGLANLGTGGLYGALSKKKDATELPPESDLLGKSSDELKKIASYDPGFLQRLGNLLSGGIYGAATGMTKQQGRADEAAEMIRQEELQKRLMARMARNGPQPFTTPQMVQPTGAQTPEQMFVPQDPNAFY